MEQVLRVLVADRDRITHEIIARTMRRHYRTSRLHSVTSAAGAIRAAESGTYDIVFLDAALDQHDGAETVAELRRVSPEARICVMGARPHRNKLEAAIKHGAALALDKPLSADALLDALAKLLPEKKGDDGR